MAPCDRFFATQRTMIWILPSIKIHVELCVFCCWMVFTINITNFNLNSMNNMSLKDIFHVAFPVNFFTVFLVLQFFVAIINLTAMTPQQRLKWSFLQYLKSTLVFPNFFKEFTIFLAGSVSSTDSGAVSLIFTAYSVVSPISTAAAHLSLLVSLLGSAPLLGLQARLVFNPHMLY